MFLYHLDYAHTWLGTDARECPTNGQWQFKGLLDVYHKALSTDGIAGLYPGFGVSVIGISLYQGMYFWAVWHTEAYRFGGAIWGISQFLYLELETMRVCIDSTLVF